MMVCRLSKQGWCLVGISAAVIIIYFLSSNNHIGTLQGEVVSVRQLLQKCIFLTEEAGGIIKTAYNPNDLHKKMKNDSSGPKNEPLTEIDIMSHRIITSVLSKSYLDLKVISEEHPPILPSDEIRFPSPETFHTNYSRIPDTDIFLPASDLSVWVDPLDATQELTEGLLEYVTVMVCIVHRGFPLAGVIHQPFLNRTYWSWGRYAMSSDLLHLVTNRPNPPPSGAINITVSRSHLAVDKLTASVNQLLAPQEVKLMPAGGAGFKVLSVISGTAQAYLHPAGTRRWDTCAAQAVIESTGGRMTGLDGSALTYFPALPARIPGSVGIFATARASDAERWRPKLRSLLQKEP